MRRFHENNTTPQTNTTSAKNRRTLLESTRSYLPTKRFACHWPVVRSTRLYPLISLQVPLLLLLGSSFAICTNTHLDVTHVLKDMLQGWHQRVSPPSLRISLASFRNFLSFLPSSLCWLWLHPPGDGSCTLDAKAPSQGTTGLQGAGPHCRCLSGDMGIPGRESGG